MLYAVWTLMLSAGHWCSSAAVWSRSSPVYLLVLSGLSVAPGVWVVLRSVCYQRGCMGGVEAGFSAGDGPILVLLLCLEWWFCGGGGVLGSWCILGVVCGGVALVHVVFWWGISMVCGSPVLCSQWGSFSMMGLCVSAGVWICVCGLVYVLFSGE